MSGWSPVNTEFAGYFSSNTTTSSNKLRFANFKWQYPVRFSGKNVQFRVAYKWDLNWYHDNTIEKNLSYEGSNATASLPAYTPTISSASIIPNSTNKANFTFNRTASSLQIDKVYIYSGIKREQKN